MITFEEKLTVKKLEHKSVAKKDGGTFDFTEAILEKGGKQPTYLVCRVGEAIEPLLKVDETAVFEIGITSYVGKDKRVWNNFVILTKAVQEETPQVPFETQDLGEDLPF